MNSVDHGVDLAEVEEASEGMGRFYRYVPTLPNNKFTNFTFIGRFVEKSCVIDKA